MIDDTNACWIKPNANRSLLEMILNMALAIPLVFLVCAYKLLDISYELRNSLRKTDRYHKTS